MLREWISSRLTGCGPAARAMGYADEQAAIQARARRCRRAWAAHLAFSRQAVLDAARHLSSPGGERVGGTLLVLGSGALLDLPLADLRPLFDRVVLADIAHPAAARVAARRLGAEVLTLDCTGTVEDLARGREPRPGCDAFVGDTALRLVVSLNLLSQLPLRPRRQWAAARGEAAGLALGRAIVRAHLDHLARLPAPALMLCDVWRDRLDGQGRPLPAAAIAPGWPHPDDPLLGVALPNGPWRTWSWDLAPRGEAHHAFGLCTRVEARRLNWPDAGVERVAV